MKKQARIKFLGMIALVMSFSGVLLAVAGQMDFIGQSRDAIKQAQNNTSENKNAPKYSFYDELKARKVEVERERLAAENTLDQNEEKQESTQTNDNDQKRYVVQVGAFNQESDANKVKQDVEKLGYSARVVTSGSKYLTQAGPFVGRDDATKAENDLKSNRFPTLIKQLR